MRLTKNKIFVLIGISLIIIGLILLMEGQLKILTKSFNDISDKIRYYDKQEIVNTKQIDNIYIVYSSGNNEIYNYIYEVIKNPLTSLS